MKIVETVLVTTHVDRHGDCFTKQALEGAMEQARGAYIPMLFNHDPRIPPIGRTIGAEIRELPDAAHALVATAEVFEPGDNIPYSDAAREMVIRKFDPDNVTIVHDCTFSGEEDQKILAGIAQLAYTGLEREEKKALEPLSVLLIALAGGLATVASGFLSKMGGDAWKCLKQRVSQLLAHRRAEKREFLLIVELQVQRESDLLSVQCILTSPSAEQLEGFWSDGLSLLQLQLPALLQLGPEIRRVTLHYVNGRIEPGFAVRKDCVPLALDLKRVGEKKEDDS